MSKHKYIIFITHLSKQLNYIYHRSVQAQLNYIYYIPVPTQQNYIDYISAQTQLSFIYYTEFSCVWVDIDLILYNHTEYSACLKMTQISLSTLYKHI